MFARNYDRAAAQLERTLELSPAAAFAHDMLAYVYVLQKRCGAALAQISAVKTSTPSDASTRGYVYAMCNRRPEAQRALSELLDQSRGERFVLAGHMALIYLGLGDRDKFFSWFERACDEHDPLAPMDPIYDPVREDPRFKALEARWILPPGVRNVM